jgi:hypothetical protein
MLNDARGFLLNFCAVLIAYALYSLAIRCVFATEVIVTDVFNVHLLEKVGLLVVAMNKGLWCQVNGKAKVRQEFIVDVS